MSLTLPVLQVVPSLSPYTVLLLASKNLLRINNQLCLFFTDV